MLANSIPHSLIDNTIRVRFAPAPTGMMHLGNIRTALMNYLFALKNKGTFVLRIEDTDEQRNFDPGAQKIIEDLTWLGLTYNEGPGVGGPYAPYFQSERISIYQQKQEELFALGAIYRCFCTVEELEKKRQRQEAVGIAPRYDRTCLYLSDQEIKSKVEHNTPFIWRVKLNHDHSVKVRDMAHGITVFELKHFSDFPITRQDGTFTFLFANFVDDMTMNITHVFRGEDHKSNTANQLALYEIFKVKAPLFWHLPIICNIDGKKLSKRDFGFSLRDLKHAGFLPEAICNYLAIIGSSVSQEVMSLEELAHTINLEHPPVTGQIKYDIEKLKWLNHKWINKYAPEQLAHACRPFLMEQYPQAATIDDTLLAQLLTHIKTDLITLADSVSALRFYFQDINISRADFDACITSKNQEILSTIVKRHLLSRDITAETATDGIKSDRITDIINTMKHDAQAQSIPTKELFFFLRLALMGAIHGPAIHVLIEILGIDQSRARIEHALTLLQE